MLTRKLNQNRATLVSCFQEQSGNVLKLKVNSLPFQKVKAEDNESSSESMPDDEAELALMLMEKFNDCPCCKGDVYNCKDMTCLNLGACFCMIQDQLENSELDNEIDQLALN